MNASLWQHFFGWRTAFDHPVTVRVVCAVGSALAFAPLLIQALFRGRLISPALRAELIHSHLWHRGCPVGLSSLRLLTVSYHGFDRQTHDGELVVNAMVANSLLNVFRRLYRLRFAIHEMRGSVVNPKSTSANPASAPSLNGFMGLCERVALRT